MNDESVVVFNSSDCRFPVLSLNYWFYFLPTQITKRIPECLLSSCELCLLHRVKTYFVCAVYFWTTVKLCGPEKSSFQTWKGDPDVSADVSCRCHTVVLKPLQICCLLNLVMGPNICHCGDPQSLETPSPRFWGEFLHFYIV